MSELREALEAAVEKETPVEEVTTPEVVEAAPAPEPESTLAPEPEAANDVKTTDSPAKTADDKAETKPIEKMADQSGVQSQHRVDRAPASWKKEAKGEWAAVPLHIRQEVHKREQEINRVLQETTQVRQQMQEVQQVVQPFMARIQSLGVTPTQAIGELLKADYTLATANKSQRAQFMAKLIKDYDVDIAELDGAIAAALNGQPQVQQAPDVAQIVQQQLQQALAPIYQQQQAAQQQVQQQAETTVEQMALDPKYPYFEDVRDEMADLIEVYSRRGVYISLPEAYNIATKANPAVSEQQQRQAAMTQANQQHLQAQKAKAAASSVSGAPASGGSNQFAGDGSLRGSIEAAFGNLRA